MSDAVPVVVQKQQAKLTTRRSQERPLNDSCATPSTITGEPASHHGAHHPCYGLGSFDLPCLQIYRPYMRLQAQRSCQRHPSLKRIPFR